MYVGAHVCPGCQVSVSLCFILLRQGISLNLKRALSVSLTCQIPGVYLTPHSSSGVSGTPGHAKLILGCWVFKLGSLCLYSMCSCAISSSLFYFVFYLAKWVYKTYILQLVPEFKLVFKITEICLPLPHKCSD